MVASSLTSGLPAELMSPGRIGEQTAEALPISLVQVEPWQTLSQVILHLVVLCVPGCSRLLNHRNKDQ